MSEDPGQEPMPPEDSEASEASEAPAATAVIPPSAPVRVAALALYLPLIAGLAWLVVICAMILAHGDKVGLYAIPYAVVLALILRRYARIFRWQAGNWKDLAALAVVDALLAVLWLERFSY